MSKILPCNCNHPYSDTKYGKNRRVHNQCKLKTSNGKWWRCVVCNHEQHTPEKK